MFRFTTISFVCAVLATTSPLDVFGQSGSRNPVGGGGIGGGSRSSAGPVGGRGGSIQSDGTVSLGTGSSGATTPSESRARGAAEFIRSFGQSQLQSSEALVNVEKARSQQIENRVSVAKALIELERARQELEQLKREYRNELNRLRAIQFSERRSRRERNPAEGLRPMELNQRTGEIHWPAVLRRPEFTSGRLKLNELFERRADEPVEVGTKLHDDLTAQTARLKAYLGSQRVTKSLGASRWVPAWQFMRRLETEVRIGPPMPSEILAAM